MTVAQADETFQDLSDSDSSFHSAVAYDPEDGKVGKPAVVSTYHREARPYRGDDASERHSSPDEFMSAVDVSVRGSASRGRRSYGSRGRGRHFAKQGGGRTQRPRHVTFEEGQDSQHVATWVDRNCHIAEHPALPPGFGDQPDAGAPAAAGAGDGPSRPSARGSRPKPSSAPRNAYRGRSHRYGDRAGRAQGYGRHGARGMSSGQHGYPGSNDDTMSAYPYQGPDTTLNAGAMPFQPTAAHAGCQDAGVTGPSHLDTFYGDGTFSDHHQAQFGFHPVPGPGVSKPQQNVATAHAALSAVPAVVPPRVAAAVPVMPVATTVVSRLPATLSEGSGSAATTPLPPRVYGKSASSTSSGQASTQPGPSTAQGWCGPPSRAAPGCSAGAQGRSAVDPAQPSAIVTGLGAGGTQAGFALTAKAVGTRPVQPAALVNGGDATTAQSDGITLANDTVVLQTVNAVLPVPAPLAVASSSAAAPSAPATSAQAQPKKKLDISVPSTRAGSRAEVGASGSDFAATPSAANSNAAGAFAGSSNKKKDKKKLEHVPGRTYSPDAKFVQRTAFDKLWHEAEGAGASQSGADDNDDANSTGERSDSDGSWEEVRPSRGHGKRGRSRTKVPPPRSSSVTSQAPVRAQSLDRSSKRRSHSATAVGSRPGTRTRGGLTSWAEVEDENSDPLPWDASVVAAPVQAFQWRRINLVRSSALGAGRGAGRFGSGRMGPGRGRAGPGRGPVTAPPPYPPPPQEDGPAPPPHADRPEILPPGFMPSGDAKSTEPRKQPPPKAALPPGFDPYTFNPAMRPRRERGPPARAPPPVKPAAGPAFGHNPYAGPSTSRVPTTKELEAKLIDLDSFPSLPGWQKRSRTAGSSLNEDDERPPTEPINPGSAWSAAAAPPPASTHAGPPPETRTKQDPPGLHVGTLMRGAGSSALYEQTKTRSVQPLARFADVWNEDEDDVQEDIAVSTGTPAEEHEPASPVRAAPPAPLEAALKVSYAAEGAIGSHLEDGAMPSEGAAASAAPASRAPAMGASVDYKGRAEREASPEGWPERRETRRDASRSRRHRDRSRRRHRRHHHRHYSSETSSTSTESVDSETADTLEVLAKQRRELRREQTRLRVQREREDLEHQFKVLRREREALAQERMKREKEFMGPDSAGESRFDQPDASRHAHREDKRSTMMHGASSFKGHDDSLQPGLDHREGQSGSAPIRDVFFPYPVSHEDAIAAQRPPPPPAQPRGAYRPPAARRRQVALPTINEESNRYGGHSGPPSSGYMSDTYHNRRPAPCFGSGPHRPFPSSREDAAYDRRGSPDSGSAHDQHSTRLAPEYMSDSEASSVKQHVEAGVGMPSYPHRSNAWVQRMGHVVNEHRSTPGNRDPPCSSNESGTSSVASYLFGTLEQERRQRMEAERAEQEAMASESKWMALSVKSNSGVTGGDGQKAWPSLEPTAPPAAEKPLTWKDQCQAARIKSIGSVSQTRVVSSDQPLPAKSPAQDANNSENVGRHLNAPYDDSEPQLRPQRPLVEASNRSQHASPIKEPDCGKPAVDRSPTEKSTDVQRDGTVGAGVDDDFEDDERALRLDAGKSWAEEVSESEARELARSQLNACVEAS